MASYILRNINDKLYREAKAVCALRGISMRAFLIDRLKMFVKSCPVCGHPWASHFDQTQKVTVANQKKAKKNEHRTA